MRRTRATPARDAGVHPLHVMQTSPAPRAEVTPARGADTVRELLACARSPLAAGSERAPLTPSAHQSRRTVVADALTTTERAVRTSIAVADSGKRPVILRLVPNRSGARRSHKRECPASVLPPSALRAPVAFDRSAGPPATSPTNHDPASLPAPSLALARSYARTWDTGAATRYASTVLTYRQTHDALRRRRGPASAHPCHWCGGRAAEWACLCDDSSVTTGTNASGHPVTYSPVLSEYVPACRSCHRRVDAARARENRAASSLAVSPLPPRRVMPSAPVTTIADEPALFPFGWTGEER